MSSPSQLTPETCDHIIRNGGPTFRTTSYGHVCVQTGERLKRGQCEPYRARVVNGTTAMLAFRSGTGKKKRKGSVQDERSSEPKKKELMWPGKSDYYKCPCCNHDTYVTDVGSHRCGYCGDSFKVVLKLLTVSYAYGGCRVSCPHCKRGITLWESGKHDCDYCRLPFEAT